MCWDIVHDGTRVVCRAALRFVGVGVAQPCALVLLTSVAIPTLARVRTGNVLFLVQSKHPPLGFRHRGLDLYRRLLTFLPSFLLHIPTQLQPTTHSLPSPCHFLEAVTAASFLPCVPVTIWYGQLTIQPLPQSSDNATTPPRHHPVISPRARHTHTRPRQTPTSPQQEQALSEIDVNNVESVYNHRCCSSISATTDNAYAVPCQGF